MVTKEEIKNIEYDNCPPNAEATIESIRSLGYNLGIAVSDIIDNSITAGADTIWIYYSWDKENSYFSITDNGKGMGNEELFEAMRLGTTSPTSKRDEKDLGRFGLGLKTASFSQCRKLTVKTKQSANSYIRKWDLDHVNRVNDWQLLKSTNRLSRKLLDQKLEKLKSGTVVLWQSIDRIITLDDKEEKNKDYFYKKIADLREYLAMIFHRYLTGPQAIKIILSPDYNEEENEYKITPWDPFITNNSYSVDVGSETLTYKKNKIKVNPFILPHHSKYRTKKEHKSAGGPWGWNRHQGFFIYRNKRLLMPGGWLGFFKQEDHYKLARIRVDISNNMDEEWKIGIKKVTVTPPDIFKKELIRIAKITREKATKAYRFRGKLDKRGNPEVKEFVWKRSLNTRSGEVKYFINQKHPVIEKYINEIEDKASFKNILNLIAKTIPVETIVQSDREYPEAHTLGINEAKIDGLPVFEWYEAHMKLFIDNLGLSEKEAFNKLSRIEPFNLYAAEIETIRGFTK
ncbi:MAG: ATP-binding protein [Bacteroidetes bacterium]|nr:ATP-binding protein [Bacteroidota bacterium]